jgi:4-amino-4-deoxy-L-arabinose transferase-like glycosyltransferase
VSLPGKTDGPVIALLLAGGMFLLYVFVSSGIDRSEGSVHYMLTQQLLLHHRLSFDQKPALISVLAPNGRYYLMHEFGNSAWMLPTAGLADALGSLARSAGRAINGDRLARLLITFNAAAYVAAGVAAGYTVATRGFGAPRRTALLGAVCVGLGSQMLAYSENLFDGVATGCWMALAVVAAVHARRRGGWRSAALCGVLVGMAVITRLTAVLAVPGLLVYLAHRQPRRRRAAVAFVLALVPFAAWQLFYNAVRTGSPLVSAEMLPVAHNNYGSTVTGAAGLLFSPGKSIFIYTPLLLLAPWGAVRAWRADRVLTLLLAWIAGTYLLFVASLQDWPGAYGWGPRHIVVVEPLLLVFVVLAFQDVRGRASQFAVGLLVVAGMALNLASITANWHFRLLQQVAATGSEFPPWDLAQSQWLAQLRGVWNNLLFILGRAPAVHVAAYNAAQEHAANTFDTWWLTAAQFGVPRPAGLALGALALAGGVLSLRRAWQATAAA